MTAKKTMDQDNKPSREEAMKAVEVLLRWAGEDPSREGLLDTPKRVVKAYEEFFSGYTKDAAAELTKTFEDIEGFDDMVLVKDIEFVSHCEHHLVPILGKAHVAYWPDEAVVGISKLARVVDTYAKRLVSQENMTKHIVQTIEGVLKPKGVAVAIEADHQCMSIRGVKKAGAKTITSALLGDFKTNQSTRQEFMSLIKD